MDLDTGAGSALESLSSAKLVEGVAQRSAPQNSSGLKRRDLLLGSSTLLAASAVSSTGLVNPAQAQNQASAVPGASGRPNILLIMADDVGVWNLSTYHRGMMGGRTPNIDRIAQPSQAIVGQFIQLARRISINRSSAGVWRDERNVFSKNLRPGATHCTNESKLQCEEQVVC